MEHVLPTGQMHLVFRLSGAPLQLRPDGLGDPPLQTLHGPVIGGARSSFYIKRLGTPATSVGALLRPGAARALLAADASELAERHTPLADIWGADASLASEQIASAVDPVTQLAMLARILLRRLTHHAALPALAPDVQQAIAGLRQAQRVSDVVGHSGYSHRALLVRFRQATGLTPKAWSQVWRMQRVLDSLRTDPACSLARLAADCGFSDQAHLNRAFRAFAGVTPPQYRQQSPRHRNHLPMPRAAGQISSIQADRPVATVPCHPSTRSPP